MFIKNKYSSIEDDTILWRYMSFSKFQSLITRSALYFCRIDCFEDTLEATQPKGNEFFAVSTEEPWYSFYLDIVDGQLKIYKKMIYASCWHINSAENPEMWENYVMLHGNEGIAIKTTFEKLSGSFVTDRGLTNLTMKYVDYNSYYIDFCFPNYPDYLLLKDKKFEYENELRIITLDKSYPEYDPEKNSIEEELRTVPEQKGEFINVDLNKLILSIYLSPNSTTRFKSVVEELLSEYNINSPVIKSL